MISIILRHGEQSDVNLKSETASILVSDWFEFRQYVDAICYVSGSVILPGGEGMLVSRRKF